MRRKIAYTLTFAALFYLLISCGTQRQAKQLQDTYAKVSLTLPKETGFVPDISDGMTVKRDTFTVQDGDKTITIMKAIKDEDGEMVAHDVLDAAMVTARFRNVAERNGEVDIQFRITIPENMRNDKWQIRFQPRLSYFEDTVSLEKVIVTGTDYRKTQLRGYEQYNRFLKTIVEDTTKFINYEFLEIFIKRNIPDLWSFRSDTTIVSDERFASVFGVTEQEAIEHYTNRFSKSINERRKNRKDRMYKKYIKVPISNKGIRLDTVLSQFPGDFQYDYLQTIKIRPKLRKVDVIISGEIYQEDKKMYTIPDTEPLTFYISSISSFVDNREKYLTKVIERHAEANTACYVEFASGKTEVDETLGYNREEISRIKDNLSSLVMNLEYDLDSIVVTAASSPEGAESMNRSLSLKRSKAISEYFDKWLRHYADSIDTERGFSVDVDGNIIRQEKTRVDFKFISHSIGENWKMLDNIVMADTVLTDAQKDEYFKAASEKDLDARELKFRNSEYYLYLRQSVYPRLRTVKFDFHLHRKGMIQDTVHTTVLDSVYMDGVQAIRERDYERALEILRPYNDYNTAIAYICLDYNASAMKILENLEKTANVNYMLAVLYSRKGDDRKAVECYIRSCSQDPAYIHRGNLDPEISVLIKRYNLNQQPEDEFEYSL